MQKWLIKSIVLVLVLAGFLGGIIGLGQWALENIRQRDRYAIAFSEIDCPAPPGMRTSVFLLEVQFLTSFPNQLGLLDDDLPSRLAEGFARHPWVEKVEEVVVTPPGKVSVRLVFRKPVLAVRLGLTLRAVDAKGVLLPRGPIAKDLPIYPHQPLPPAGPAGTRWGDPGIEIMARSLKNKLGPSH